MHLAVRLLHGDLLREDLRTIPRLAESGNGHLDFMHLLGIILSSVKVPSRLATLIVVIGGRWERNELLLEKPGLILAVVCVAAARNNTVAAELFLSQEA